MADVPTAEETPMRGWGLLEPGALERIVVISPHLDDAVLGCGRLLATRPGGTVVTVFAGGPDAYPEPMTRWDQLAGFSPGDDVLAARRIEDSKALGAVGATPVWLDHVEHQYLDRPDWVGADSVLDSLTAAVRAADPTIVLAPFGLANPDHDVTHQASMRVREQVSEVPWLLYEDHGYKHIPGLLAWRVSQLFRAGTWPTPVALDVEAGAAAKDEAFAAYASQVLALEADWQILSKLGAPEQYWHLAPPPAGWERLTES